MLYFECFFFFHRNIVSLYTLSHCRHILVKRKKIVKNLILTNIEINVLKPKCSCSRIYSCCHSPPKLSFSFQTLVGGILYYTFLSLGLFQRMTSRGMLKPPTCPTSMRAAHEKMCFLWVLWSLLLSATGGSPRIWMMVFSSGSLCWMAST